MNLKNVFYKLQDFFLQRSLQESKMGSYIEGYCMMYHNITDEWTPDGVSCRCPVHVFEHYLDMYSELGFSFVSVDDVYQLLTKQGGNKYSRFCMLTFDDIPENVFQNAYPILKERRIPFTVFITTKFVDWINPETGQQFISAEHLLELDRDPLCTIGAHTMTHPVLRNVTNSFKELQGNKEWLESLLGHPVEYLAYPYGKHSSVSKKIQLEAQKAGFKLAFGTIEAPITDKSAKYLFYLPRVVNN